MDPLQGQGHLFRGRLLDEARLTAMPTAGLFARAPGEFLDRSPMLGERDATGTLGPSPVAGHSPVSQEDRKQVAYRFSFGSDRHGATDGLRV